MKEDREYNLRTIKTPTVSLPLACRSIGFYKVPAGWRDKLKPKKMFVELFWGIQGRGNFEIDGKNIILNPDHVMVLFSGDRHIISAKTNWKYRWLTIDGSQADEIVKAMGFSRIPFFAGKCPVEIFKRLTLEMSDITPKGQYLASSTAYEIFALACIGSSKNDTSLVVEKAIDIMKKEYSSVEFDISALAKELKIHRTSLSRIFQKNVGVSPISYLISLKIQQAMRLLQNTDLPVAVISEMVGIKYVTYFSKLMKKQTGYSPRQIRDFL